MGITPHILRIFSPPDSIVFVCGAGARAHAHTHAHTHTHIYCAPLSKNSPILLSSFFEFVRLAVVLNRAGWCQ